MHVQPHGALTGPNSLIAVAHQQNHQRGSSLVDGPAASKGSAVVERAKTGGPLVKPPALTDFPPPALTGFPPPVSQDDRLAPQPRTLTDQQIKDILTELKGSLITQTSDGPAADETGPLALTDVLKSVAQPAISDDQSLSVITRTKTDDGGVSIVTESPFASPPASPRLADPLIAPGDGTDAPLTLAPDNLAETNPFGPEARSQLESLARAIAERLEKAGFTNRPPSNIQSLLQQFELGGRETGFLTSLLHSRFPGGLGISLFG